MNLADQVAEHVKKLEAEVYSAARRFEEETGLVVSCVAFKHLQSFGERPKMAKAVASVDLSTDN